jgi:hypothetical protein
MFVTDTSQTEGIRRSSAELIVPSSSLEALITVSRMPHIECFDCDALSLSAVHPDLFE